MKISVDLIRNYEEEEEGKGKQSNMRKRNKS
jgi:hypothetical protein